MDYSSAVLDEFKPRRKAGALCNGSVFLFVYAN